MPEIPIDIIEKIKQRDLQNIAKQAAEGRALSSAQMKRLDEAAVDGPAGGAGKMLRVEPCHVAQDQLSQILGITDRRIRQLAGQGILTKAARGHYPFPQVVVQYCNFLKRGDENGVTLKERELKLRCEKLEQDIERRRDEIQADVVDRIKGGLVNALQEIMQAYQKVDLPKKALAELTKAFGRASEQIQNATIAE